MTSSRCEGGGAVVRLPRRIATPATPNWKLWLSHSAIVGSALLLLFGLAGSGLRAGFTHDDLMNAATALRCPPSAHIRDILLFFTPGSTFRPTGSLFYVTVFDAFGFTPLLFRIGCYLLLALNLVLAFALALRLTGSAAIAGIAAILISYHGNFWAFYVSSGVCYDLLCFFFYFSAFLYYLEVRKSAGWRHAAAWGVLYALCLGSKEMAVSLPLVLLGWEFLTDRTQLKAARIPMVGLLMAAAFATGRVLAPNGIASAGGYRIDASFAVYLGHAHRFLALAFYEPHWLRPAPAAVLLLALLAAAIRLRRPALRLALFWVLVGILPVAFIPQRGLDAVYIPAFAFALCIAILAMEACGRLRLPVRAGVLAAAAGGLLFWHAHNGLFELAPRLTESREIAAVYHWFRAGEVRLPPDSKTLFLRDPFPQSGYSSAFLLQLYTQDPHLWVERGDRIAAEWPPSRVERFDQVFTVDDGGLRQCDAAPFTRVGAADISRLDTECAPMP